MLRINVSEIMKEPGLSKNVEIDEVLDIAEVDLKGNVYARLKFTNVKSRIIVKGFVRFVMILNCVRCLKDYEFHHEFEFLEEFLPVDSEELVDDSKLSWEDLSRFTYDDDYLDVYDMIRQNILAEIPMKTICSDDCKGLCYGCGVNLNEEMCKCSDEIDPRLLPLLKIKTNKGG